MNTDNMKKPDKLLEIKAGKTGYGFLIETDGYVSRDLTENNRKIINEAFESRENGEWNIPNPFVLDVILQKFGVENANKRIYPENILKREVEKYQKLIDQRMALGECYKPDVLVLTENGWKTLESVKEGDNVLTLNVETNQIEIQPIKRKIEYDIEGNLINIKGRNIDDAVTPHHGLSLYDSNNKIKLLKKANE